MSQITLPDNVKPILSPRSRPTTQYAFVPAMIRNFFKLKPGDLLKWDIEGDEIIIKVIKKEEVLNAIQRRQKRKEI